VKGKERCNERKDRNVMKGRGERKKKGERYTNRLPSLQAQVKPDKPPPTMRTS